MLDFVTGRFVLGHVQRRIDRLDPKVDVRIGPHIPLPSAWMLKRMAATVSMINALEDRMRGLSDEGLKDQTRIFRERIREQTRAAREAWEEARRTSIDTEDNEAREAALQAEESAREAYKKTRQETLDRILPEAFAVVREASRRVIGLRHFDVQMVGGIVLHEGRIAEMATGEGKTLVATLPAYLNGLTGEGVHVVTVNDYLARRDREWMGPIYEFLGLTVGTILHDMDPAARRQAYACDITYGTNNEFGFDYLRDNMVGSLEEMVQRGHHYAIVDEVDSILIDEARTPLIISGPAETATDTYYRACEIARTLKGRRITENEIIEAKYRDETIEDLSAGYDYLADEKARSVSLTEQGEETVARLFGIPNLHEMETVEYRHHILQALKAREFFRRDVEYVVRDGEVIIVDEFTGRLMPGRRWSDGLHQAVEAKEGITIERENQTLATVTFQNYFRMYDKLSGMTGTAHTEANEFRQIYRLDCVVVPTNRPLARRNYPDCVYKTQREKYAAVVEEIADCHRRGQPVLVGTISIEKSELLSEMLRRKGIPHEVLNAKYHEREAQIVAQAGRYKAVTIATNMAGRGTDILLGGNPDFLARALATTKADPQEDPEKVESLTREFLDRFRAQAAEEHDKVVAAGGLHVLGTERHESRRIDNQLRGRSGRQGDPGSSRFYVSLEDDLMRLFGSDRLVTMMDRLGMQEGEVIEHPWVTRAIEVAQKRVENQNFEIRKQLLEYDNVMNKQREAVYGLRRQILESASVRPLVLDAIAESAQAVADRHFFEGGDEVRWDMEGLEVFLKAKFGLDLGERREEWPSWDRAQAVEELERMLREAYERRESEIGAESLRILEKVILLNVIDGKWKDHLYAMDQLKGGVGLRAYGQRDPLVEYKREGFEMFQMMHASISEEAVELLFKVRPVEEIRHRTVFSETPQELVHNDFSSLGGSVPVGPPEEPRPLPEAPPQPRPVRHVGPKVGRNDPCPCGSGKKYKKCCGR